MEGKSFLGAGLEGGRESFNFGKRKDSPPPGAGKQDERLGWHRPGVTARERVADPGPRQVACFLGSKDEEPTKVLDPMQSDWGFRRSKEGEIAVGLPPGWEWGGGSWGTLSPFPFPS